MQTATSSAPFPCGAWKYLSPKQLVEAIKYTTMVERSRIMQSWISLYPYHLSTFFSSSSLSPCLSFCFFDTLEGMAYSRNYNSGIRRHIHDIHAKHAEDKRESTKLALPRSLQHPGHHFRLQCEKRIEWRMRELEVRCEWELAMDHGGGEWRVAVSWTKETGETGGRRRWKGPREKMFVWFLKIWTILGQSSGGWTSSHHHVQTIPRQPRWCIDSPLLELYRYFLPFPYASPLPTPSHPSQLSPPLPHNRFISEMDPNFNVLLGDSNTGGCKTKTKSNGKKLILVYVLVPFAVAVLVLCFVLFAWPRY